GSEVGVVERDQAGEGFADAVDAQQLVRTAAAHGVLLRTGEGDGEGEGGDWGDWAGDGDGDGEKDGDRGSVAGAGSPHERRTTSRGGRVADGPGRPSIRSTSARQAARTRSRAGPAMGGP